MVRFIALLVLTELAVTFPITLQLLRCQRTDQTTKRAEGLSLRHVRPTGRLPWSLTDVVRLSGSARVRGETACFSRRSWIIPDFARLSRVVARLRGTGLTPSVSPLPDRVTLRRQGGLFYAASGDCQGKQLGSDAILILWVTPGPQATRSGIWDEDGGLTSPLYLNPPGHFGFECDFQVFNL